MSEPTKWTPQQQIDSLAAQLHSERESRKREKEKMGEITEAWGRLSGATGEGKMSETIQMENDDFCEIMCVLHGVGLMMAREKRTKTDDERWALFSRVIRIVTRYDERFQPSGPADSNADREMVK